MPTVLELISEHGLNNQIKQCPYDLTETAKTTNNHLGFMKKLGLFQSTKPATSHQEMVFVYQMNKHVHAIREYFKDSFIRRRRGKPASLRMKYNRFSNTLAFMTPNTNGEVISYSLGNRLTEAMFSGWTTPVIKRCLRVLDQAEEVDMAYHKDVEALFKVVLTFLAVKVAVDYYHRPNDVVATDSQLEQLDKGDLLDGYEETSLYKLSKVLSRYASHGAIESDFINDLFRATDHQLTSEHVKFITGYVNYCNYSNERFDMLAALPDYALQKDTKLFMTEYSIHDIYSLQLLAETTDANIKFRLNSTDHAYTGPEYMEMLGRRKHAKTVASNNSELMRLAAYMAINKVVFQ